MKSTNSSVILVFLFEVVALLQPVTSIQFQPTAQKSLTSENELPSTRQDDSGLEANERKRLSTLVKRTIVYPGSDVDYGGKPFCYDRYVTGNCRYRTDPEYCYQYEWTAYAIIQSFGSEIQSDPPGLLVESGNQERVRVWVKTSCCTSFVRIITIDPYTRDVNACVIDVRELQGLHPGEIAGIVLGVIFVLIIIIVIAILLIRKRQRQVVTAEVTQQGMTRNRDSTGGR